ncbi:MAG: M43 family zinc metalloprotease [Flavobacteriales bacterium]
MRIVKLMWAGFIATSLGIVSANGQENWCGSDHVLEEYLNANPANRAAFETYRAQLTETAGHIGVARSEEKYIVPVVVHVLYNDCDANISMEQIRDGLRILNEDYNRTNPDTSLTRDIFKPMAAGANIEFRLAQIDPDGKPTNGVNRIKTSKAVNANDNNGAKSVSYWPSNEYMNLWVVETIDVGSSGGGIVLGYAQFPSGGGSSTYGVVIRNDAFGTIGTSSSDGRTLTHEIGHCFGLYHTFQDGCGGNCSTSGDGICDTPPTGDVTYNCAFSTNTCSNDASGSSSAFSENVPDMIENYMSYNSCQNLFTQGQVDVMQASLKTYSRLKDLVSEDNLVATGVTGVIAANFELTNDVICSGNSITINDASLWDVNQFNWEFEGGAVPANSTNQNPSVMFPNEGVHDVKLTAGDGTESVSMTKSVFVVSNEGRFIPYEDNTESALSTDEWFAVNKDGDDLEWKISNEAAVTGTSSFKMDNYGSCGFRVDELISQSFDLSPYSSVTVSFKQAFAQTAGDNGDFLRLYVSGNCGETWDYLWVAGSSNLASTSGYVTSPFVPGESEWKSQSISTSNQETLREGALFKFEFNGNGGNNLYIDDFKISGTYSGDLLLRAPFNGKKGMAAQVLIDWKSVGYVESYEYQIDKSVNFDSQDMITGTTTYISQNPHDVDTEFLTDSLEFSTTYYWRVRYVQSGNTSDWSETWNFTISETGVGIEESAQVIKNEIRMFPNPATDMVTITSTNRISEVTIYDFTGRLMTQQRPTNSSLALSTQDLASGVYIVSVTTENGQRETKQLIVR